MKRALAVAVSLCTLVSSVAVAQEGAQEDAGLQGPGGIKDDTVEHGNQMASAFVGVVAPVLHVYGLGFGVGARYAFPILPQGVLPNVNESIELEGGVDVGFMAWNVLGIPFTATLVAIPVEGRWTFHFTDKLAGYGKLGVGWYVGNQSWTQRNPITLRDEQLNQGFGGFYVNTAVGGLFQVTEALALRAEAGLWGLKVGAGFAF